MKNFFLLLPCLLLSTVYGQDTLQTSASIGASLRSYAPVTGSLLNENPVIEAIGTFKKKGVRFLIMKSIDPFDLETSIGNYLFIDTRYTFVSKKEVSVWSSISLFQKDTRFLSQGKPLALFQTNLDYERNRVSIHIGIAGIVPLQKDARWAYLVKSGLLYSTPKNWKVGGTIWLSNLNATGGLAITSPSLSLKSGSIQFDGIWNHRLDWTGENLQSLLDVGMTYTFK